MESYLLEVDNLSKKFGQHTVLEDLELQVKSGKMVCILGISGSGKTTLLNILSGLLLPSTGSISILGKMLDKNYLTKHRNLFVGIIFQNFELLDHMNAIDNVIAARAFISSDYNNNRKLALQYMNALNLADHLYKFPSEMSGGQQQRVGVARALMNNPAVILADEPTGSLDLENSNAIMHILKSQTNDTRSVIYTTHNLRLTSFADEVYVLRNKKLEMVDKQDLTKIKKIKSLYSKSV